MRENESRLIYSTDGTTPISRTPEPKRGSPPSDRGPRAPSDGIVRIFRDRGHRGGKTVSVITGLPGDPTRLAEIATMLKRLCGSGGAVKNGEIEIQGDHREKIATKLRELGFRPKLAGG